jgi:hypothetical protein
MKKNSVDEYALFVDEFFLVNPKKPVILAVPNTQI